MNDDNFVTLQHFLKLGGFIQTGGQAKFFLRENDVLINGEKEERRGRKLKEGDIVSVNEREFIIHVHR